MGQAWLVIHKGQGTERWQLIRLKHMLHMQELGFDPWHHNGHLNASAVRVKPRIVPEYYLSTTEYDSTKVQPEKIKRKEAWVRVQQEESLPSIWQIRTQSLASHMIHMISRGLTGMFPGCSQEYP